MTCRTHVFTLAMGMIQAKSPFRSTGLVVASLIFCPVMLIKPYSLCNLRLHKYWKWRVIIAVNFPQQIDLAPNVWLHSSFDRASHRYRGGHGFESRWSPDIFQASSFRLLKLENLLRWSLFTFIYHRSTIWISYIFYTNIDRHYQPLSFLSVLQI